MNILFSHIHLRMWNRELCSQWWAQVESNHRPHAYQACALTFWAMSPCYLHNHRNRLSRSPFLEPMVSVFQPMVEMKGFEPLTPCLQGRCSPNWATPPYEVIVKSEKWRVNRFGWKAFGFSSFSFLSYLFSFLFFQWSLKIEQQL